MAYITKGIGGFYYVKTTDGIVECKARGIFRKRGITPVAGDNVTLSDDGTMIDEILPRKNVFIRPPIANLDILFIVTSTTQPVPSTLVLDQLAAAAIYKDVQPVLVVTKSDLAAADMLRTVAEANPDTPLIVEIKSRSEYKHTYLEELCRATIAELKTYPGPYCIESFDPRVVGIVRRQAPGLLRGQLADSYRSYRKTGAHPVPAFVFSHCLGNFLGRPDFIAWCPEKRNWAVRLCARLGAMMVMWTALPEHDTRKLEAENDAVIFQWYAPKQQYK